jgi:outer membrane immunogenic protein
VKWSCLEVLVGPAVVKKDDPKNYIVTPDFQTPARALRRSIADPSGVLSYQQARSIMKNYFGTLAAIVAVATSGSAIAADFLAPTYKAPVLVNPPLYIWSGFYVGAHVGGGWAQDSFRQTPAAIVVGGSSGSINSSGVIGGGQAGFNWVFIPNWLLGFEADVSGANLDGTKVTNVSPIVAIGWTEKVDAFGTARGRLGYVANNWLFYATGGFAWSDDTFMRTQLAQSATSVPVGDMRSNSPTRGGWAVGGGVEWGIYRNLTAKIEYLHFNLDDEGFSFNTINNSGIIISRSVDEGRLSIDTIRVGVNYRFGWP